MSVTCKVLGAIAAATLLVGCAETDPLAIKSLPKGEPVSLRAIDAEYRGQQACTEYREASNSCASLVSSKITGNTIVSREVGAVKSPDGTVQRFEVISRGTLKGNGACVKASGISLGKTNLSKEAADFILSFTRQLIAARGEVCGTYYRAGDGFVISSVGADGRPFPPGDTSFRFVGTDVSLRAQ